MASPSQDSASQPPRRGRPRSQRVDQAVLDAALELLSERGYARMSVDAVAERAGVSKPTIYLRYPSKAELAGAALASAAERRSAPRSGDTRADLVAILRQFRQTLERAFGTAMLANVLAAEHEAPELPERFRAAVVAPMRAELRELLEEARARGELQPGADVDAAVHMLIGAYWGHYVTGDPLGLAWPASHVDLVLAGLASAERRVARPSRRAARR